MKVYVQGEKKLLPIQEDLTADRVKDALGYTPADENDLPDITNEDDSTLYVSDKDGNVIVKVDSEGLHTAGMTVNGRDVESALLPEGTISAEDDSTLYTTDKDGNIITKTDSEGFHASAIDVNGKDVESGLVTDDERETWNNKSDFEGYDSIDEADDSTLYVTDKDGNIIAKIDSEGLHTAESYVGGQSIADHLADYEAHKAEFDTHKTKTDTHIADTVIHTTAEEKAHWNDKSFDSLTDSPISSSDTSVLYVVDSKDQIIAKIDENGLHSIEVYIGDTTNGEQSVSTMIEVAVAKLVGSAPETLDTLEEVAQAIKDHQSVTDALDAAIGKKANQADFESHTADKIIHITADEREEWNAKASSADFQAHLQEFASHKTDFNTHVADSQAHIGKDGDIKLDDDECFYVTDKDGNILFKIDKDGADISELKLSGIDFSDKITTKVADIINSTNYAGSSEPNGSATSAEKLNTSAGSSTKPIYFSGGKPVACSASIPTKTSELNNDSGFLTDDSAVLEELKTWKNGVADGTIAIPEAEHATDADTAFFAQEAEKSSYANGASGDLAIILNELINYVNANNSEDYITKTVACTTSSSSSGFTYNGTTSFTDERIKYGTVTFTVISYTGFVEQPTITYSGSRIYVKGFTSEPSVYCTATIKYLIKLNTV